jgi:hypothetical protein
VLCGLGHSVAAICAGSIDGPGSLNHPQRAGVRYRGLGLMTHSIIPGWNDVSVGRQDKLRLTVDFLHGGRDGRFGSTGTVYLSPKSGDRSGLKPHIKAQFDAAGLEPTEGLRVHLVDDNLDRDDAGVLSYIEVDGTLTWVDDGSGWRASYDLDSCVWVPATED